MTKTDRPLLLRLPFAMVDRHLRMEQILLAAEPSRPWAQSWPLLAVFAMTKPEQRFARRLLQRNRNIWLFRCNQRGFCGDFIAVNMSAQLPRLRSVVVIELKVGAELKLGGGGAGNQLQRAGAAVTELTESVAVTAVDSPLTLACGDGDVVLHWVAKEGTARSRQRSQVS